jgi:16S rRNA (guanine(527)-N(7))-methyltransferase RsmG
MNTARIAELLEPFLVTPIVIRDDSSTAKNQAADSCHSEAVNKGGSSAFLSPAQLQHISTYIDILCRWNARINLTAIRDREEIVTRHFGESLFAARHLFPRRKSAGESAAGEEAAGGGASDGGVTDGGVTDGGVTDGGAADARATGGRAALEAAEPGEMRALAPGAVRVADIGSGAGFPGLPIKLWCPVIALTLIESNHKKAAFLREITRALTLTDVDIQNTRAESLSAAAFDVVTLRAVERFEAILPTAAALVAPAGRLALLIGSSQQNQARAALINFTWSSPVPIPGSRSRAMLIATRRETTNQVS